MWSRLKWFSLSQNSSCLVFLLFTEQLVSQSWSSVVSKVGVVGEGLGRIVAVVVVNGWNSSVVEGGSDGSLNSSVVIGSHNWSSDNWGSHSNGLLVNVRLSWDLNIDVRLGWDLNMDVRLSRDLLMDVGLSWNLLVDVRLGWDLDIDVGLGGNLNMDVGLGCGVEVGIGHRGVVSGSINSTVDSSRSSSGNSVVASREAGIASRVTIASSIASIANWDLGLNGGKTRQNSDEGLHCDLVNCYY